jgi:hypothetical protein
MKNEDINPCPACGEEFDNVFDATDHLLEEDEEFDPALILPNGYRLMIGSLLRCMYRYAHEPRKIEKITQDTYMTLFTAETSTDSIADIIEEAIVRSSMVDIDNELKSILDDGK